MGFRRNRYLECFYCGRKTSTRYDGQKSFECPNCDATNHLDENGDITDPPSSAIQESTPVKVTYAVSRTISPPSSPSGSIFCETCLTNQRLFTASIAQYLPEDPDAPDYAERESQYYEFRKRLDKIYPQICADCEPKVRRRIEQSAYTAKTDVLRRMIDQSKTNKIITRRSWLDAFDLLGKSLWSVGLFLEVMSHVQALSVLGMNYCATRGTASWVCRLLVSLAVPVFTLSPEQAELLRWSFYAGLCGCWWNPRLVHTVRGFTKHLVGMPNWYSYQLMTVCVRLFSLKFFGAAESRSLATVTDFGGHLIAMAFALLIARVAATSIRVDTTPLFGGKFKRQLPEVDSRPQVESQQSRLGTSRSNGVKNMSDLLDEIIQTPSAPTQPSGRQLAPLPDVGDWGSSFSSPSFGARNSNLALQSLSITEHSPPRKPVSPPPSSFTTTEYEDEMDWSPTTSRHRAFSSFRAAGPGQQGFSQAPTDEKKGAFWYRVPPAPTTPAQRLFNPPNQPRLRNNIPAARHSEVSFREPPSGGVGSSAGAITAAAGAADETDQPPSATRPVTFAGPSFFPPVPENDPRNTLSDIFSESFSLKPSQEEKPDQRSWIGSLIGFGSRK